MIIYVDEVGCSTLAGPLVICAVATDQPNKILGVKDSKQLSKAQREKLFPTLSQELIHEYGFASLDLIKEKNIFWAKFEVMKQAIDKLISNGINPEKVIVDGNFTIPNLSVPQEAIIKADDKFWQVGAASILAKVTRDRLMEEYSKEEKYSHYDWDNNAAYPAPKHWIGVTLFGPTDLHRKGFKTFEYYCQCHENLKSFLLNGGTEEEFIIDLDQSKNNKKRLFEYCDFNDGKFTGYK